MDTNIIIAYLRKHDIAKRVDLLYKPLDTNYHKICGFVAIFPPRAITGLFLQSGGKCVDL